MSQQQQPWQQGQQIQPPNQMSQQSQQMGQQGQQMGMRLSDVETPQQRAALDGIQRAVEVCEWCADQCIQHADVNMVECIRLCEDVSEIGEGTLTLIPRRSRYSQTALLAFQQAAQDCAQECSRHSHGHCQECAQVLGQAIQTTQQLLSSFGQQGGQGQQLGAQSGGFQ